ncbi:hypothetical protein SAMN06265337_3351 [Hymenobacter gelipurpurascens]|uniref:Uncharacterized protein n=1 Tax=Hymenobacter gelipurpurascens TaxID=89968 RepID=A0A212UDQ4_9BACT|nr:hypothetical protein SAMN06265337_3351 [Hymenobacter gelipurpurascens]
MHYRYSLLSLLVVIGCRSERAAFSFQSSAPARPLFVPAPIATNATAAKASSISPSASPLLSRQPQARTAKRYAAQLPKATRVLPPRRSGLGHSETTRHTSAYGKARRQPRHPSRDYTPLVMATLLVALGSLLLIGAATALTSSFIPLIGVLLIVLGGVVYFHWRYE